MHPKKENEFNQQVNVFGQKNLVLKYFDYVQIGDNNYQKIPIRISLLNIREINFEVKLNFARVIFYYFDQSHEEDFILNLGKIDAVNNLNKYLLDYQKILNAYDTMLMSDGHLVYEIE